MTIEEYKQQIRSCFRNDFVSAEHFIKAVLSPLFHEITPLYEDDMLLLEDFKQYRTKGLQSVHKVAQITDAFNPIEVYDIVLQDTTNIAVARVYIQQFVRSMALPYSSAFLLFHYADATNRDWRFSYLYKEDTNVSITNAKRFTYLFGKEHICRTAEERFVELFRHEHIEKQQLLEAFSVEALSKEFFTQYDIIYQKFCKHVEDHPELFGDAFNQDTTGKTTRDYVKKLLGRITFLYFLQKKRWLNNNLHFMRDLFFQATPEQQANFLDEVLEPLFFDCLNRQRPDDIFNTGVVAIGAVHIPYLNGGLFEREKIDEAQSCFPADYFRELLEFFEQFNFTIDENDPNDAEVGVDPEMLGKIFESQLEDNKDKGAFYTPKEIVQYMCRESLIAYLTNCAMENTRHKFPREKTEESVRKLIQTPEQIVPKMNDRQKDDFGKALRVVKICDPAIGSGAFPMGLLNELVRLRVSIGAWADKPNDIGALKREIIQNNIYGVDIERGAIDIARLRFWLSIVVDESTPSPLPNFDYKFMQGNSLITTFGGEYINLDTKEQKHERWEEMEQEKHVLYDLKKKYYTASGEEKLAIAVQIKDSILRLISMQLGYESRSWVARHAEQTSLFEEAKQLSFDDIILQLPPEKQRVINLCKQLHAQLESNSISLETRAHTDINFFDWRIMFTEVFDSNKSGFDIVIGNPPYIKELGNEHIFAPVNNSLFGKKYHAGKMDYWYYFMHKAIENTCDGGTISFITSRYWINSAGAKKVIKHVSEETSFINIVDIGKLKVFDNVAGYHMVSILTKDNSVESCKYYAIADDVSNLGKGIYTDNRIILRENLFVNNEIVVEDRIVANTTQILDDVCNVSQGIVEASDKISSKMYKKNPLPNHHVGEGIFVLSKDEYSHLNLSAEEEKIIELFEDDGCLSRYCIDYSKTRRLIYADSINRNRIETDSQFVNIRSHLDNMSAYITSSYGPYGLHRARKYEDFTQPKLIGPSMFVRPCYSYDDRNLFVGMSYNIITPKEDTNLLYILGILNSSYTKDWLYSNAKHRGAGVDVGVDKLRTVPIPVATPEQQQPIIDLVSAILAARAVDPQADTASIEEQVDQLVCQLYDLATN